MTLTYELMRTNAQRIQDDRIRERVLNSIAMLNRAVAEGRLDADWPSRIDPRVLTMEDSNFCVLGQLFNQTGHLPNGYEYALDALGIHDDAQFAFDTFGEISYSELDEAWLAALGESDGG